MFIFSNIVIAQVKSFSTLPFERSHWFIDFQVPPIPRFPRGVLPHIPV